MADLQTLGRLFDAGEIAEAFHNLEQRLMQRIEQMANFDALNAAIAANTAAVQANATAVQTANALLAQLKGNQESPAVQAAIDAAADALSPDTSSLTADTASLNAAIAANQA